MALYDDYFTNEDKPFAENLNDALLLSNVFDMTVNVEAPLMFSNSTWVSTTSPRKCGVSILTLKEGLPSGVSVGTDSSTGNSTLTGNGTVKLSWYPNFNSFGKFKAITWENTGTIVVNLKTINGTTIASNISKGTIENQSNELRTLQEIVIELVFTNATLKSLTVTMENKQGNRYGATVGITDVTGLDDRLTAIESKDTQQDGRLTALEEVDDGVFFYQVYASDYNPSIDSSVTVYCKCTDIAGSAVSGKSLTLYQNGTSVSSSITNENGIASWTVTCDEWGLQDFRVANQSIQVHVTGWREITAGTGELWVNDETKTAVFYFTRTGAIASEIIHSNAIPSGYRPKSHVRMKAHNSTFQGFIIIENDGTVKIMGGTISTSITISCQITYGYGL